MSLSYVFHLLVFVLIDQRKFKLLGVLINRIYSPLNLHMIAAVNL